MVIDKDLEVLFNHCVIGQLNQTECLHSGLHKTGIHGIQDIKQIVECRTKKVGPNLLTKDNSQKKQLNTRQ